MNHDHQGSRGRDHVADPPSRSDMAREGTVLPRMELQLLLSPLPSFILYMNSPSLSLTLSSSSSVEELVSSVCCCNWERRGSRDPRMGRGKIEIKKIENSTSRQVTYSKRRAGIMKKAAELSVLCDADLSLIMFSSTGRFSEYCSPSTDSKSLYDRYQQATGIDLWGAQYEKMQSTLNHLNEVNHSLRREIRQRMGEDLDEMEIKELRGLEQNIDEALNLVRSRKYHVISTQTDTYKKKLKNSQETHKNLMRELEMEEHAVFGYVDDDQCNNDGALALVNEASYIYSFRTQPSQTNLLGMGYGSHDLRLA